MNTVPFTPEAIAKQVAEAHVDAAPETETDDFEGLERYLAQAEASAPEATWGELLDGAKGLRQSANGSVAADKTPGGGGVSDDESTAPEPPPSPPRVRTPEEQQEMREAVGRLERFDPGDREQVEEWLNDPRYAQSFTDEERAELELRVAEMAHRGEYVAWLDSHLREYVDNGGEEMRLLSDEIDKARTKREQRDLDAKYVELARTIPKVKSELRSRDADREHEVWLRARAEREATEQIVEARRAKLREAAGELSALEMLAQKEKPRRQSQTAIDAAAWELEQPLDPDELERISRKLYEQNKAEGRKNRAVKYREYIAKDDASAWSRSVEFFFPGGGQ